MQLIALPSVRFQGFASDDPYDHFSALAIDLIHREGVQGAKALVQSVVVAGEPIEDERVKGLCEKICADYRSSVFSDLAPKERPIRGPFGEAIIELKPGAQPVKQRPFHIQGERKEALTKLIDGLIRDGKLEPGKGPWSSPAFPVPKKKPGEYRLVVDYRTLNDATVNDAHPLPRIEDILQRQTQYCMWSALDMKDGYHQMPLKREHRNYTCMTTPKGNMQWTVLVMGLKNGGSMFQRMMEWVLRDLEGVDVYLDDVIMGSKGETTEERLTNHERVVRRVLDRLAEHKLIVSPSKAHLFCTEVEFVGHVLREGKRSPAPGKLTALVKWELPRTVTQLRGFLGLANYYSSYVKDYAEYAGPLMSKLQLNREDGKKGSTKPIVYKDSDKVAFEKLKQVLAANLELFRVDPDKPFVLKTDASDKAIGAVLEQQRAVAGRISYVPVGFFSRKLAKSQFNWTPREKETYAVVSALRKWAGWIGLQPLLILTDHKSLEDWVKEKMDTPSGPAGRRARWHETLSKFDLTVQYLPGKDNVVADALSRYAYPACKAFQDASFHGSEEARREMEKIIADELAEGRTIGMISAPPPEGGQRTLWVAGTVGKRHLISAEKVFVVTRSGRDTENGENSVQPPPPRQETMDSEPEGSLNAGPLVDEAGNEITPSEAAMDKHRTPPSASGQGEPESGLEAWSKAYETSMQWGAVWNAAHDPNAEWPEGARLAQGKLIWQGRVAVPETKVMEIISECHKSMGHIGIRKLVKEVSRRYVCPASVRLNETAAEVRRGCATCQACEPPNWSLSLPLSHTPVPSCIFTSVSLDVFSLPLVQWNTVKYDQLLICVDRQSGWIIARPTLKVGFTAEKAAHLILENGWDTFGIPSVITSDQGAQFVGQWWRTMCARLGIRQAYSQAYRPQANGRAEVAGRTIIGILRKLQVEEKVNWVEALPRVLRMYHDTPGESGISPFQVVFGRERNLAGCPYEPLRECESAHAFFDRMSELDAKVAATLNESHWQEARRLNEKRAKPTPYHPGDKVWLLRPKGSAVSKLDTWWVGPVEVAARLGDLSYQVFIKPGVTHDVHLDQLKPFVEDVVEGQAIELYHHMAGYQPMETQPDEWMVQKIKGHRQRPDGNWEFLTQWEGSPPGEETWEPAENFIPRYCVEFPAYLRTHHLDLGVLEVLRTPPGSERV